MGNRLEGLSKRIAEAGKLASWWEGLKYLVAFYVGRLHVHFPKTIGKIPILLRAHVSGKRIEVWARTNGSDAFVFREIFIDGAYDSALLPSSPQTILDLGGNCGYASIFFGARFPSAKLACVEAMPWNAEVCKANFARNGTPGILFSNAISASGAPLDIFVDSYDGRHSAMPQASATGGRPMSIPGITVTEVLDKLGWPHCDLLKVDIEGYERVLFQGCPPWLSRVNAIVCEIHPPYTEENLKMDLGDQFSVRHFPASGEPIFIALRM